MLILLVAELMSAAPIDAAPRRQDDPSTAGHPWLEPRGINVVDLVGLVPEEHLRDTIVTFSYHGFLRYLSGARNADQISVTVEVVPQYHTSDSGPRTSFNCIGQWAVFDQWPAPVAPMQMRLYENGSEISSQVQMIFHYPAQQGGPIAGTGWTRYPGVDWQTVVFADDGAIEIPANMGCFFFVEGRRENLTADFTFPADPVISATYLGTETFTSHSYIGPGAAGHIQSLQDQLMDRFPGIRHDKHRLNPPPGTEYLLLKFPPTPIGLYSGGDVESNLRLPSSGTYRLAHGIGDLSVDHTVSMLLPLNPQWRDADLQAGHDYLSRVSGVDTLSALEYFVPPGFQYDPCMSNGGCPPQLLDAIYNATMTLTVTYYSVRRTVVGLNRIPLRQVGPSYNQVVAQLADLETLMTYPEQLDPTESLHGRPDATREEDVPGTSLPISVADTPTVEYILFAPLIANVLDPYTVQPDDPTGCPCGWFDQYGRMFDVVDP